MSIRSLESVNVTLFGKKGLCRSEAILLDYLVGPKSNHKRKDRHTERKVVYRQSRDGSDMATNHRMPRSADCSQNREEA